jgi:hypothetical protein
MRFVVRHFIPADHEVEQMMHIESLGDGADEPAR